MKQLRTIITILVVLAMALSSVATFAADEAAKASTTFSDITPGTTVSDAVTKLVGYGVINGYEDGTFKPDNTITRAEFAAIVTRFKGIGTNLAADAVTGFSDLDSDTSRAWARPYVKAAAEAKIINGFEDGTFRAAEPVTYEQAVKMIVCAVGYEPIATSEYNKLLALGSANLTWSSGYIAAAQKNRITINAATSDITAPTTRAIVAILTSNAYEVPKLNQNTDASGNTSYEKDEGTYGEGQYNTQEKIEGTIIANYYTSLEDSDSELEKNEIIIENSKDGEVTYEMSDSLLDKVNVEELLGKKVTAYYAKDEYALVSITPERNTVVKVEESTINRPLKGSSISYYEDGINRSVNVGGYTFIYNGKSGYINSLEELEPIFRNGYIEVNETTDVVNITSYDVMVVNSYSKSEGNGKVYLKYETYGDDDLTFYEFPGGGTAGKPEIYVNGTKKDFSSLSLSQYNVINYLESPDVPGAKIRRMYITTGAKSGKVTGTFDDDRLVELNNTEYYLTNDYSEYSGDGDKKAPFEMSDSYTYYLDYTGQIAAVNYNAASQGSFVYGYVVGADEKEGKIRIVKKDGISKIFELKDKIKFDGVTIDSDEVVDYLEAAVEAEYADGKTLADSDQQVSYYQPIKYSLSGDAVNAIDTVVTVEGGNNDTFTANALYTGTKVKPGTSTVKVGSTTYSLSNSTIVMYVPGDTDDENFRDSYRIEDTDFAVMTPSKAFSVSEDRKIEVFGADDGERIKTAGLILVYGMNPTLVLTGSSPYMVVTGKSGGDTLEGYMSDGKEISNLTVSEDKFYTDEDKAWVSYSDVSKGDFIRVLMNGNKVIAIEMVYDASEEEDGLNAACPDIKAGSNNLSLIDDDERDLYINYAEAIQKDSANNRIAVTTELDGTEEEKLAAPVYVPVNSSTVYYSFDGNDIISGDSMDVINASEEDASRLIYVRTYSTGPAEMVYVLK